MKRLITSLEIREAVAAYQQRHPAAKPSALLAARSLRQKFPAQLVWADASGTFYFHVEHPKCSDYWRTAQAMYERGDLTWLPCTEEFFHQMLTIVPPQAAAARPALGYSFANGKPWTHGPAGALHLTFRSRPTFACRISTLIALQHAA